MYSRTSKKPLTLSAYARRDCLTYTLYLLTYEEHYLNSLCFKTFRLVSNSCCSAEWVMFSVCNWCSWELFGKNMISFSKSPVAFPFVLDTRILLKNGWFLKNSFQVLPFCSVDSCRNERNGNQISGERKAIETVENIAQICILYWVTFA